MQGPSVFRPARGVVLLLVAGGVAVGAQSRQAQPVFRAGTTYVSLDVVVTDRDDRLVTDLRQDEFVVKEQGRRQTITDFIPVSIPPSFRPIDFDTAPPAPADVTSNALSASASRALAIIVDDTRLHPSTLVPTARALRGLLESLAPDDQVALTYVSRSDLGRDFTSDHGQLIASVNALRGALGVMPNAPVQSSEGAFGAGPVALVGLSRPPLFIVLQNAVDTLSAARQSRRAIVLVGTAGCNPADRNFGDLCRDLIKQATRSGVPIYGLNPLGLMDAMASAGAGGYDAAVGAESGMAERPPGSIAPPVQGRAEIEADIRNDANTLRILARETGGRAFVQSSVQGAVQSLMADNGSFYLLGYYPDPRPNDGKFQEVEVSVTRPGLRVRSRAGYTADGGRTRVLPIVAKMTKELGAGLPDPSLPVRAFVAPVAPGRSGTTTIVTAEVSYPMPDGGFSGVFSDEWRMGILALDSDGRIDASFQRPVSFKGTWKPAARGTFVLNEVVDLPRTTVSVRVGVSSEMLNRTGTVHIAVDVPDFNRKELQLGPLVLGVVGELPGDLVVGADRLQSLVPFPPTTIRTFTPEQTLRVHGIATWRSDEEALQADVQVDGVPVLADGLDGPFRVITERNGQRRVMLDCTLALDGLSPGPHVLRVRVHLADGEPVTREVPFSIR